jgi:hypothetical protein
LLDYRVEQNAITAEMARQRSLPTMLNWFSALFISVRQLLRHDLLSDPLHAFVPLSLRTVLLDLVKHGRIDVSVDRAPHDLSHHAAKHSTIEVDFFHAALGIRDVRNHWIVANVDVVHDDGADDLAAGFAEEIESVHRVVYVKCSFETRTGSAEESVAESELLGLGNAVVVDPLNDNFCSKFVDIGPDQKLADWEKTSCCDGATVLCAHCAKLAVLAGVDDAVASAGEEDELVLVSHPAEIGLCTMVCNGIHVDSACRCCCSRGLRRTERYGIAVLLACHVEILMSSCDV